MIIVREVAQLRKIIAERRQLGANRAKMVHDSASVQQHKVGFVPTMGYLHEGHASLMQKAREMADTVVLSIFVNPIQFGPTEDLDSYPRDEARDLEVARREGVDIVFLPTVAEMYPQPTQTKIRVSALTDRLCGASRPGHFDGVTTVVAKLFNVIGPDLAFFGMKDAQQVAVLQQMVTDLNMNVTLIPCPIVREADGLALSSRNVYLSAEQREQALVLSQSLLKVQEVSEDIVQNTITIEQLHQMVESTIASSPLADIDYIEILTFPGLEPLRPGQRLCDVQEDVIVALAVKFGNTRLIDNIRIQKVEVLSHV
ncbi:pantoate--beta-alanine ligase [Paenibacillus jamilae]|jgi:pantoate--beta-alanine ligase|nr:MULTISPECIES: pantoate--beta-alanine ligase [Paenibacillus]MDP9675025.1 pantoate--beta-alanine ligase [Paenibacillus jamilae]KAF6620309.1 pantoate--beta-alanine ligase [Paenibacillus sp. EKM101P]KAF6623301.1 pantoate--beta-alanine ligase [Paenibacillus sp. EKM102P]KAF6634137.1 pantoate--beta-alanine ligase [Paenibacillus sp. EKM10P]KAF6649663.1 pantoate--beta-alanine ligase [Paenibacillus sp. EKM11P]